MSPLRANIFPNDSINWKIKSHHPSEITKAPKHLVTFKQVGATWRHNSTYPCVVWWQALRLWTAAKGSATQTNQAENNWEIFGLWCCLLQISRHREGGQESPIVWYREMLLFWFPEAGPLCQPNQNLDLPLFTLWQEWSDIIQAFGHERAKPSPCPPLHCWGTRGTHICASKCLEG